MATKARRSVICYLVLTFSLSSIFYVWSFTGASLDRVAPP
jgi:hypothetical protein